MLSAAVVTAACASDEEDDVDRDIEQVADSDLQLRRDNVTMGVTVFPDDGLAAVSGTGGCVR